MKAFFFCLIVGLGTAGIANGQSLKFQLHFGSEILKLDSTYVLNDGTELSIETLRFYVTGLEMCNASDLIWKEENSYHLMDASKPESLIIPIPENEANWLVFKLGTDSLMNVSGAMGGDLDPSKGMYWAWNSGYINFKLEGTSSMCNTRNNAFQFHLGGYAYPNATVQTIEVPLNSRLVSVDIAEFLNGINLAENNTIMSPGPVAVMLSEKAKHIFKLKDEN